MPRLTRLLRLLPVFAVLGATHAAAAPVADFASGTQGWSVVDFNCCGQYTTPAASYTPDWSATGGTAGGFIGFTDPSGGSFYFAASDAFTGDLSAYLGGTLSFARKVSTPEGSVQWRDDPDVVIVSAGQAYVWRGAANPGADWTAEQVTLAAPGWSLGAPGGAAVTDGAFAAALTSVSALYLRGETINGVVETTALDSVQITPVPEPAAALMLLAGFAALGGVAGARRTGRWRVRS